VAGLISPQDWVDGVRHVQDRAEQRMVQDLANGSSDTAARYHAWASIAGDLIGINGAVEASYDVDLATGKALGTADRWQRGGFAVAQLAGTLTPGARAVDASLAARAERLAAVNLERQLLQSREAALARNVANSDPALTRPPAVLKPPEPCQPGAVSMTGPNNAGLAARSATTTFQGLEVRAVRNLSHVDDATLRAMADRGFAPRTVNGDRIVLHHHQQNPNGFIVEMPAGNHNIWNTRQHPFGNTAGAGLTAEQRAAFNDWRVDYWRSRAQQELGRRAGGQ
jgi:hypothetical protein